MNHKPGRAVHDEAKRRLVAEEEDSVCRVQGLGTGQGDWGCEKPCLSAESGRVQPSTDSMPLASFSGTLPIFACGTPMEVDSLVQNHKCIGP